MDFLLFLCYHKREIRGPSKSGLQFQTYNIVWIREE